MGVSACCGGGVVHGLLNILNFELNILCLIFYGKHFVLNIVNFVVEA